jgi:hypothetical protein
MPSLPTMRATFLHQVVTESAAACSRITFDDRAETQTFCITIGGQLDKPAGYFDGDNYVQHNPKIGDGLTGLWRYDRAQVVLKQ